MGGKMVVGDDGLIAADVGEWNRDKYRVHKLFATLFTKGVRNRWDSLVYLDLFSGPGRAQMRKRKNFVSTAAMNAVELEYPFSQYIFADSKPAMLGALKERIGKRRPELLTSCSFEPGDSNENLDNILRHIPKFSKARRGLTFCFVDPYSIGQLKFSTLRAIKNQYFTDFLVLLAIGMDANRFLKLNLEDPSRTQMDDALDDPDWRDHWLAAAQEGTHFKTWFADRFCEKMVAELQYLPQCRETLKQFRSDDRNLDLYHLGFFSGHKLGYKFFSEADRLGSTQTDLFG